MTLSPKKEVAWFAGLGVFFLALNLVTSTRYPAVWVDEIQFADPAVNLVLHGEFSSSVWIVQNSHEFWAGNAPLYSLLLAQWLRWFGVSAMAVRSLNYVLMLGVVGLVWALVQRHDWIPAPAFRLTLAVLLMTAHGVAFAYRTGRYDVVGMLIFAIAAFFWFRSPGRLRLLPLGVVAMVMPFAGLQLIPAAVLVGTLALAFQRRPALFPFLAVLAGLAAGVVLLYAFYASHGVWPAFRASTSAVGAVGQGLWFKIRTLPHAYWSDKSELLLLLAAMLLAWRTRRSALTFAIASAVAIPAALHLAAKFPIYYSWMVFVPLAIAVCGAMASPDLSAAPRRIGGVLIAIAAIIGLPLRLAAVSLNWSARSQAPIEAFVKANLGPSDAVVSDFKAYYPVKLQCRAFYAPTYLGAMTPAERHSVTALLIRPADLPVVSSSLGGDWHDTGLSMPGSRMSNTWLLPVLKDFQQEEYDVKLYRQ